MYWGRYSALLLLIAVPKVPSWIARIRCVCLECHTLPVEAAQQIESTGGA